MYFCCGIMCLLNELDKLNQVYTRYMDDGGIVFD